MTQPMLQAAAVRVPCSTSNLGPGFDCIGLAFQRYLAIEYLPTNEPLRIEYAGTLTGLRAEGDVFLAAFNARLRALGVEHITGALIAHSEIPVARGLGSSAAATVAGILLADSITGRSIDRGAALALATEREGHPDNAAPALLGGLVAVARDSSNAPHAIQLPLSPDIGFVYAAPEVEVATPAARAALPQQIPHSLAANTAGRALALVRGLATGDPTLLRLGLYDELHVPHRLPLIPRGRDALDAAVSAGAWGATISGSGSGLIALCPPGSEAGVLAAMEQALAADGVATTGFIAAADTQGARAGIGGIEV